MAAVDTEIQKMWAALHTLPEHEDIPDIVGLDERRVADEALEGGSAGFPEDEFDDEDAARAFLWTLTMWHDYWTRMRAVFGLPPL